MRNAGLLYFVVKEHKAIVLQTLVVKSNTSSGLQYELHALVSFKKLYNFERFSHLRNICKKVHFIEDGEPFHHHNPDQQILVFDIDSNDFALTKRAKPWPLPYEYKTMRSVFAKEIKSIFHDGIYWKCRAKHYRTYKIAGRIGFYLRQNCYDDKELDALVDRYCHDPRSFLSFLFSMHSNESQALLPLTEGPYFNALEDDLYLSDAVTDTDNDSN